MLDLTNDILPKRTGQRTSEENKNDKRGHINGIAKIL